MLKLLNSCLIVITLLCTFTKTNAQTTSWKGTTSTSWRTSSNWTNGVPTSLTDVIIGDANFTGVNQPTLSFTSYAKSITIGGTKASTLTQSKSVTVSGNITILSNGTFTSSNTVSLTGNWSNAGTYTGSSNKATVTFAGTAQTLGGTAVTTFRKLKINAGTVVTLASNVTVSGASSLLTVAGTINPSESPTYTVTSASTTVSANGVLKVNASTFAGNYSGTPTLSAGSIVEYSSTTTNQTISNSFTYTTLKISGASTIKTLGGNLTSLNSSTTAYGNIYVLSGTLDLSTYTAARGTTTTGGTFSVSNGATLKIGGTNTFPVNYNTNTLSLTSTVEYNGAAQTVSAKTYGNLTLSSSSLSVTKTMPGTAFTIAGDLVSAIGSGTAVSYTAASNITISGNITIGASTTFNGSTFSHSVGGNWTNSGTFTGTTSTITMGGPGATISGSGTQNFNNLTLAASNITSSSTLGVSGNLATTGSGAFTHNSGLTLTMSGTTKTVSGLNITLANLTVSGTVTNTSSIIVTGNISVAGSFTSSAGNITMNGSSKTISGAGAIGFYGLLLPGSITTASSFSVSSALDVSGSFSASAGTATFTGSATLNGTANLFSVTMNGTSLLLSTSSVLGIANLFTITAGTLNVTSAIPNTVSFNGTGTQTIPSATYNQLTLTNGSTKTAGGAITTNGLFTINTSTTFNASSYTHTLYSNLINNGTLTASTSTVTFAGTTDATVTGGTTFNILTINKNTAVNGVTLNNDATAATVNMTTGFLKTGSNMLTITTTRTGNGYIYGNIKRTTLTSFSTGIAYAFEGPDNTITFSAVSSVNSITVAVTQGSISDFPFGSAINRVYDITIPAGTYTATLRLHYEDDELNGNTESSMQLWKYNGATWNAVGKTANNTTSNFIEQSGLTNITNRWGISDNASVLAWNGSVSSVWTNPSNWTAIQGTPGSIPTANDIVQLGTVSFTNNPAITSAVTLKSISFGSVAATTLTLSSGGSLTVNGNITGTWSANAAHSIIVGAQTLTVSGNMSLSDGTTNHTIALSASTGTITIGGSLTESGGANITFTGAASLYIGKDFTYTNGTFTAGSSTVYYNGTNAQSVGAVTYNNIVSAKASGIASINNATTVSGNLTISSSEFDINATTTITGDLTVSSGATIRGNTATINISGNLFNSGTFIPGNGTITFNGTNNQSISLATFNNIVINKASGNTNFTGNVSVYGDFSILAGNIDLVSYSANRTSLGGTFTLAAGTSFTVGGAANFPSSYSTYSIASSSTVIYNGTGAQSINGVIYGNLTFSNGGSNEKTLTGTTNVTGDITINSGATVNAGAYTISLDGNWTNNGTFTAGTGAVLLNGTSKTVTGTTTFNKLTVYGSYTVAGSNITYNGWLYVTTGATYAAGSGTAIVNGDLTNSGILTSTGTTTFTGTTIQTIRLLNAISSTSTGIINFNGTIAPVLNSTSTPTFATLNINNTGGINPSVGWTVLVAFNIASGATFTGGISTHTISRAFTNTGTVSSTGTLLFNPTTSVTLALGSNFSSTGTVEFGGTGLITMTGTPSALHDVIISNTNASGITPSSNWTMNGNYTLNSNSIFNASSYSYTVAGNLESNGTLNGGTSTFTMSSVNGELSGSPTTTFNNFTITGTVFASADYNVSGNFTNNGVYDVVNSEGTLIITGTGASTIGGTTNPSTIGFMTINKTGATATMARDISSILSLQITGGTLDASTFALTQDVGGGELSVSDNATLKIGGTNSLPTFSSYTLDTLSTVDYSGSTQSINSSVTYGNLTVSASGTKTPAGALTMLSNFSLSNGTFTGGSYTHTIAGNWTMSSGTFTNTGTTVLLNGIASQSVSSTGNFRNLTINKASGSVILSTDANLDGVLTLTNGNINAGSNKLILSSTGSVSRTSGHIIGNMQKNVATGSNVARTFEVGDTNGYAPVTVTFASVSVAGNLIAKNTSGEHTDVANSGINTSQNVNKYWTLTNSGITFTNYSSVFNFLAGDIDGGSNTANFIVANKTGGVWSYPTVGTKTSTSTQITTVTIFGDFLIGQNGIKTWTGAIGSNWNDAGNWSPSGVPTGSENVTVSTGTSIIANTAAACNNLTCNSAGMIISISSSNSLTINGACTLTQGKIDINGQTLTLNGSFTGNSTNNIKGSLASNLTIGSTYSNISGTNLYLDQTSATFNNYLKNFTVNNSVTMANVINIAAGSSFGTLTIGAGATLTTAGVLTFKSDANGTARVAAIPTDGLGVATGFISGNVNIERYITARRAWRLMTTPLSNSNSIYESWQNNGVYEVGKGTFVTGANAGTTTGIDASTQNTVTMKGYNPATQGFRNVTNTKTEKLATNTGNADNNSYYMFIRGDRNPTNLTTTSTNTTTLTSTGTLQTGKHIFTASSNYNTYTLIGNPYASPVNFNNVVRSHILKRFIVWDPTLNRVGGYVVMDDVDGDGNYSKSVATSSQGRDIQSGQAVLVLTDTAGSASLTFYETSKSAVNNNTVFRPTGVSTESFNVALNLVEPDNSIIPADGALAEFNNNYSAAVNLQDAIKLTNTNETLGFYRELKNLAIERRPIIIQNDTLFFNFTRSSQRNYQFVFNTTDLDHAGMTGYLEDAYTGITTPINLNGTTTLNFSINADVLSQSANRFRVVFNPSIILPVVYSDIKAVKKSDNIELTWKVENEVNIKLYQVERSVDGITFTKVATQTVGSTAGTYHWTDVNGTTGDNYYRIVNIDQNGSMAYSTIVKVKVDDLASSISVFPNPVTDGRINLQMTNIKKGMYKLKVINQSGQEIMKLHKNITGTNVRDIINLPKGLAKGIYELEITNPENNKTVIKILNQ
ncbi:MAG: hypothetical protein V4556_13075 [Bacteroidota bacterium]